MKDLFGDDLRPEPPSAAPKTHVGAQNPVKGKETGSNGHSGPVCNVVMRSYSVVKEGLVTTIWFD